MMMRRDAPMLLQCELKKKSKKRGWTKCRSVGQNQVKAESGAGI